MKFLAFLVSILFIASLGAKVCSRDQFFTVTKDPDNEGALKIMTTSFMRQGRNSHWYSYRFAVDVRFMNEKETHAIMKVSPYANNGQLDLSKTHILQLSEEFCK